MSMKAVTQDLKTALRRLDDRRLAALLRLDDPDLHRRVEARAELRFLDAEHTRLAARLDAVRHAPDTWRGAAAAWLEAEWALLTQS
jgi:hypothetical protein